METNFTPWNDTLEIAGDTREEIEREEALSEAPEPPEWTEEELCDFAARSEYRVNIIGLGNIYMPSYLRVCQNTFKPS